MINIFEQVPQQFNRQGIAHAVNIAVTPQACFDLERNGIPYSIMEDYYHEHELIAVYNDYISQRIQWLNGFEQLLATECDGIRNNPGLVSLFLGTCALDALLDSVLIHSFIVNCLQEKTKPLHITYYRKVEVPENFSDVRYSFGNSVYSLLIPLFCKNQNIKLTLQHESPPNARNERTLLPSIKNAVRPLCHKLKRRRLLATLPRVIQAGDIKSFLFLDDSYGMIKLIGEVLCNGHRCMLLSHDKIICLTKYSAKPVFSIHENLHPSPPAWGEHIRKILNEDWVWRWFDALCGMPVRIILKPRFEYFLAVTVPKLLAINTQFSSFFRNHRIDYLVSSTGQMALFAGAIYAAGRHNIKRIRIRHGESVRDAQRLWEFREVRHADHLVVANSEVRDYYLNNIISPGGYHTQVHIADYGFENCTKKKRPRQKKERPLVVYAPGELVLNARYMGTVTYPCVWYYKLQQRIADFFASRPDYYFVFKPHPAVDVDNPIERYLLVKGYRNIIYSRNPFVRWLSQADCAIFDYPETALYEAMAAQVPYFVLHHSLFKWRRNVIEMLGGRCITYTTHEEAINALSYFLDHPDVPVRFDGFIERGNLLKELSQDGV